MRNISPWGWFLQRVTAALLVVFLGIHLWYLHYVLVGKEITFEGVQARLQSSWFLAVDAVILAAGIYHALYGIRGIILDLGVSHSIVRALTWSFTILGMVGFALGMWILLSFV